MIWQHQSPTLVQPDPRAEYVDFESFDDGYHEGRDLESASHPQTMVVYGKDGRDLSPAYGAPARVHSPIKLGYKNTNYLTRQGRPRRTARARRASTAC